MKNRWLNLLFALLSILVLSLSIHLFIFARPTAAASLIINILKPLNILLSLVLFYIVFRYAFTLYMNARKKKPGFRLQTKLVLGILPLTLVPSLFLLLLSTSFLDDMLIDLVSDSTEANIIEASEDLRRGYLEELGVIYKAHGEAVSEVIDSGSVTDVQTYLARYAIQGVEHFQGDVLVGIYVSADFPSDRVGRLERSASPNPSEEPLHFDDGFLLARFNWKDGERSLNFIFSQETPFSERFLYIRDSYNYLHHTKRKTDRVKGINQGILVVATLAVLFGGIWTGIAFARRFLSAFKVLINGADQVSKGNFDTQLDLVTGDEIEDVVTAFNSMTRTLKNNQTELQQKARDLGLLNTELSDQIEYNQTILQQVRTGILSTDEDGLIRSHNPASLSILGLDAIQHGSSLEEQLREDTLEPLLRLWKDYRRHDSREISRNLEVTRNETTLYVSCGIVPLRKEGERFGSLIVLEDLTQLLNAQKTAAWQEVAKRVAHEIKNPLTPIQLSIQRIRRKAQKDAPDLKTAIESAHETIMSETDLLKNLVNEFSTFAKMPAPVKTATSLDEVAESVVTSYQPAFPNIHIKTNIPESGVRLFCDPNQIRQVLSNLIQNAATASGDEGVIEVHIEDGPSQVVITVEDQGKGIPESELDKIFVPYYSKSPKGTGLGLAIVKRIIEDHDGQIKVAANQPKGARFTITLPREQERRVVIDHAGQ